MNQIVTKGIVLARTSFGEADRIITVLTSNQGKIRLVAKGVRKIKSRLAGGIELFSLNDITFIVGRGDLGTLVSSRLIINYPKIVTSVDRTMYGYEVLKNIHKITEDSPGEEYFDLLNVSLCALDNLALDLDLIRIWFNLRLLQLGGYSPNLKTDIQGNSLSPENNFSFSFDDMAFTQQKSGPFGVDSIKLLRLADQATNPQKLSHVEGTQELLPQLVQLTRSILVQNSHHQL